MTNTNSIYISIQDYTGDRKLKLNWDPHDEVASEKIEEMFEDLQLNGYRFFSVKKVIGIFDKKGREVKTYDPYLGEMIYEKDPTFENNEKERENKNSLSILEVEKPLQEKYEEPKKFDPKKDKMDTSRDYVATKPMRAG